MLYLTYEDYHGRYGGLLTEQQYAVFGARAAGTIDRLTLGRAEPALAEHPDLKEPLELACMAIADALHGRHMAFQREVKGIGAAAAIDGYSEQYLDAQAARRAAEIGCRDLLRDALGADPHGLLYQGVGCCV